jgi:IS30 family transposase
MCSHHLIEPVACTPASGWEKGQVENQVGNLRDQMFRPKPRVKSLTEFGRNRRIFLLARIMRGRLADVA